MRAGTSHSSDLQHRSASPDNFVRLHRFGLTIPNTSGLSHLPPVCLTVRATPFETVNETKAVIDLEPEDFEGSDEDERPTKKRGKSGKRVADAKRSKPDADEIVNEGEIAVEAHHDVLEMKTDEPAQQGLPAALETCTLTTTLNLSIIVMHV